MVSRKKPTPKVPLTGVACNGCGLVLPEPVDRCPKCGDDEPPVFRKVE